MLFVWCKWLYYRLVGLLILYQRFEGHCSGCCSVCMLRLSLETVSFQLYDKMIYWKERQFICKIKVFQVRGPGPGQGMGSCLRCYVFTLHVFPIIAHSHSRMHSASYTPDKHFFRLARMGELAFICTLSYPYLKKLKKAYIHLYHKTTT